jgi:pilus assembly protein CpaE
MKPVDPNIEATTLAIFTVCGDSDLCDVALSAPMYVPGVEFAGDFHDYITKDRRPQFPPSIRRAHSCVAFIDFDRHWEQALETVEALSSTREQHIVSIGISSDLDTDRLLEAMRAGCSEFIRKPVDQIRFQQTLEHWQDRLSSRNVSSSRRGQVLTFFGSKGGVGTTTLAIHLAIELAQKHSGKVLLIDHHHQLGHVCLHLAIKNTQYHFDDLVRNADRLDTNLLKGFVVKHSSGLDVLAAPEGCMGLQTSTRSQIEQVLDFLRAEYDFILIDTSFLYDSTSAFVQCGDEVNIIVTPDILALRDLTRHVEHLGLSAVAPGKLRIVVNRVAPGDDIRPDQIAKAVREPVFLTVPNLHPQVTQAMNAGEPLSSKKKSAFSSQISLWAGRIAPTHSGVGQTSVKKKLFGLWK